MNISISSGKTVNHDNSIYLRQFETIKSILLSNEKAS